MARPLARGGRGSRARTRTFARKSDAVAFEDELRRRRRLGELGLLPGSQETLDENVCQTWAQTHAVTLAPKTAKHHASLYDVHIGPHLGAGREVVLQALMLLGSILQRARGR